MISIHLVLFAIVSAIFGAKSENVTVNVDVLNIKLNISLESNYEETKRNGKICEARTFARTRNGVFTTRQKPKGICKLCCPIKADDVRFILYTKDRPNGKIVSNGKLKNARGLNLNKEANTVIYTHGFIEYPAFGSASFIKDAYLNRSESYNVILVDWSNLSSFPWYFHALENVKIVANIVANFIETYVDRDELTLSKTHLIGFSLGAQIVGFVGKYLRKDLRIPRITGLDPAYPGFSYGRPQLSYKDAEYVDVIHTDGGNFGVPHSVGHADFYINGGTFYQPGCTFNSLLEEDAVDVILYCSHMRAWRYYAESVINPRGFPASSCRASISRRRCKSIDAYMGFAANKKYVGNFYLDSNSKYPFGTRTDEHKL